MPPKTKQRLKLLRGNTEKQTATIGAVIVRATAVLAQQLLQTRRHRCWEGAAVTIAAASFIDVAETEVAAAETGAKKMC